MKIKEDIVKWREDIFKLTEKVTNFENNAKSIYLDIKDIQETTKMLAKVAEEMSDILLTLIRQQIGD